jgi:uridine monophosphate synthetase
MQQLILSLYQIGAIQFGEFTLKSGEQSTVYVNLRKIISYPDLLKQVAKALWEKVSGCRFDLVCGVPYTALPIATTLSLEHDIPMIMRRKEKKEYGTKQTVEGVFETGQTCLIIEDVITTGGSILETAQAIEAEKLIVRDVAVLIDRNMTGKARAHLPYQLHAVCTLSQAFDTLLASGKLKETEKNAIQQFISHHTG